MINTDTIQEGKEQEEQFNTMEDMKWRDQSISENQLSIMLRK